MRRITHLHGSAHFTIPLKDGMVSRMKNLNIQASAYEKQGCATIAHLVTQFLGYRCVKGSMPSTK